MPPVAQNMTGGNRTVPDSLVSVAYPHLAITIAACAYLGIWIVYGTYVTLKAAEDERDEKPAEKKTTHSRVRSAGLYSTSLIHAVSKNTARAEKDAIALLARISPSEEASGELKMDRIVGWFTLYWDIPTMAIMPFMVLNVWPPSLRIPFHTVGSVFYIGADINFEWLRESFLWFSLAMLSTIVVCRRLLKSKLLKRWKTRHAALRYQSLASRLYFGALFTIVVYQSGTLLEVYKSCDGDSFGNIESAPCKRRTSNATSTDGESQLVLLETTTFDMLIVLLAFINCMWAFREALLYVVFEKNASSPAFMWLPSYEAVRYTAKSVIAAAGSLFKTNRFVTMPTFLIGFASLAALTYHLQPCQGQGRKANNLRVTGFVLGAWFSLCGLACVLIFDATDTDMSTTTLVICYCILVLGAVATARVAWKFNDQRARIVALPDAPWHELLSENSTAYVRRVAANGFLMHVEARAGELIRMGKPLASQALAIAKKDAMVFSHDERYIRFCVASAFLLAASSHDTLEGDGETDGPGKALYNMHRRWSTAATRASTNMKERVDSRGVPLARILRSDISFCTSVIVDALLSKKVEQDIKGRISLAFVLTVSPKDSSALFDADEDLDMKFHHALLISHLYQISRSASMKSLLWLEAFALRFIEEKEKSVDGKNTDIVNAFENMNQQSSLTALLLKATWDWCDHVRSSKTQMESRKATKVVPSNDSLDQMEGIEHILVLIDAAWTLDLTYRTQMSFLCMEAWSSDYWERTIRIFAPLLFSSDIKKHAAAWKIFQGIKESAISSFEWGSLGNLGPEFDFAARSLEPAKTKLRASVEAIARRVDQGKMQTKQVRTPHVKKLLDQLSSKGVAVWGDTNDAPYWRRLYTLHITAYAFNLMKAFLQSMHETICSEIIQAWQLQVGAKSFALGNEKVKKKMKTFKFLGMEMCPFPDLKSCPMNWSEICIDVAGNEIMGAELGPFLRLCADHIVVYANTHFMRQAQGKRGVSESESESGTLPSQ